MKIFECRAEALDGAGNRMTYWAIDDTPEGARGEVLRRITKDGATLLPGQAGDDGQLPAVPFEPIAKGGER